MLAIMFIILPKDIRNLTFKLYLNYNNYNNFFSLIANKRNFKKMCFETGY